MPLVWEAVAALATILNDLSEFESARAVVDSIMPHVSSTFRRSSARLVNISQALEGADTYLVGNLYAILTDAHVGLAGTLASANNKEKDHHLSTALICLDRAKQGMFSTNSARNDFTSFTCTSSSPHPPCHVITFR